MLVSALGITLAVAVGLNQPPCAIDRMMALLLDEQAFDQGPEGWRRLANPDCFAAAADLIRDWRAAHPGHSPMLHWHEGQMRAAAGQYEHAAMLFEAARAGPNEWNIDTGWNAYVDASIAFVRRDAARLQAARNHLADLPPPPLQTQAAPAARAEPLPENWPPNLDVVDGLIACFDKPYADAMNPACRQSEPE